LEIIEKKYNTTSKLKQDSQSITDRFIHKLTSLVWSPDTSSVPAAVTTDEQSQKQQQEFSKIVSMLEQSAREYQNNDALLLLAELNFVSCASPSPLSSLLHEPKKKKLTLTLTLVLQIRISKKLLNSTQVLRRVSQQGQRHRSTNDWLHVRNRSFRHSRPIQSPFIPHICCARW
jgi:hypothetical protein